MLIDPNELDAGCKMLYNEPLVNGKRGKSYIFSRIVNREAQVLSLLSLEDPIEGETCYNISYVVKKNYQGSGLAVETVNKGI